MILSTNFLKDYLDLKDYNFDDEADIIKLADQMTLLGNEYDSASKLINATNLTIGEVVECEMHPDSDHLHVCKVNIGGGKIEQIVCGAPNVRKGLKVIVALPGAKLPEIEIKRGVIRGVESNGMLCSMAELGLDKKFLSEKDIVGIHELDDKAIPGEDPIKYLKLDDGVIDFDLTANRGDLLSVLGMAYEVGALTGKKVKDIDLKHKESKEDFSKSFKIKIDTENCKIYLAKRVDNVVIKESPQEIKEKLIACGIRPINNVVDISNYVMMETGQPLHFFDADKLNGMIQVRMAKEGEKITTLDSKERVLSEEDIVISDGKNPIALAGVMGGLDTEITEETKNVVIESAIFDSVHIRKTSNKILRSESSNRFEKGLDPNRTYKAIERACKLLEEYAGGSVQKGTCVYDKADKDDKKIEITVANICNILGTVIPEKEIISIFKKLGFEAEVTGKDKKDGINSKFNKSLILTDGDNCKKHEKEQDDVLLVNVPSRRIDISIKEDLIEEVGRIYGVDKIGGRVIELPIKRGQFDQTSREIRNKMVDLGLDETLTYSLMNIEETKRFTIYDDRESIGVLSPITEERSHLRQTLVSSLYKTYEYNKARGNKDISLFELSKSFYKIDEEYVEENKLAALMTGRYFLGLEEVKVDFYVLKGVVEEILEFLGYANRYSFITDKKLPKDMHPGKTALISVNNDTVGFIGEVIPTLSDDEVYICEINLDKLLSKQVGKMKYKEISKFPTVEKDIALLVDKDVPSSELQKTIKSSGGKLLLESRVFDLYEGKGIAKDKKSIAFRLTLGSDKETLTDEQIAEEINKIVSSLEKKFNCELRG